MQGLRHARGPDAIVYVLRILHVTPYSAEAWAYGGIPRLVATLTRSLARRGHDVTVCTTDACDAANRLNGHVNGHDRLRPWPPETTPDRVVVRVFPNVSNRLAYHSQLFIPLGLGGFLRQHAGSFDVAHLHACRNLPGMIAARHLSRANVPFVLAPNGTAPRIERHQGAKRAFDLVWGRRILRKAACVLAVSPAEVRQLRACGVPSSAIRLVPNPVDVDEFTPPVARGAFRRRIGIGAAPLVLFLGKLTPRKRLDVLIDAFARLQPSTAHLVIAGNDMGGERRARAHARTRGIDRHTLFTGLLRGRDRLEALADADVLVYPSQDEIFGLVPLESLLAGTPVIVADDSGCGEVIRSVGGGQVVPLGNDAALANAIDDVLHAPAHWREAAVQAAKRVTANYHADVVSDELTGLYHSLVTEHRAGPAEAGPSI